jgi:phosphoglucosamine mutase
MADKTGRLYNGDELLYILVADGVAQGKASGVAGTLMTNLAIEKAFERLGVPFARAKVGDRYVLETLVQNGWIWGGESSGHLLCLDRHSTGDGIISALQVISAMQRSGQSLAELTAAVKLFPQKLINVRIPKDFDWEHHAPLIAARLAVEEHLGQSGRILIRASGTEPVLRVMVEAESEKQARESAERLALSLPKAA